MAPCGSLKDKNGIWCKVPPTSLGQVAEGWGTKGSASWRLCCNEEDEQRDAGQLFKQG
jgi:hypothetical protein